MDERWPEIVARRAAAPQPGAKGAVGVLVLVNIDDRVGAEINRIGAGGKAAVKFLGIEDLGRQGFPAAGRAAVEKPRPAGAEAAVFLLEVGNQLVRDGVAVRPDIGRIDGVGIVIKRIRVLDLDDDHAGKFGPVHSL